MLAELSKSPFDNKDWIFEVKYDGYRAMAICNPGKEVQLYSRNLLSFNELFAPIANELKKIQHSCLLDGEVVIEDAKGRSRFQLLQNYQKSKEGTLKYHVFDLLSLNGKDTTELSLIKRKELLKMLLGKKKLHNIFYSDHVEETGSSFYKAAVKKGLEGIIAKNAESLYYPGTRSADWLKIKITNEEEAVIAGITEPKGNRKYFGSLLLGVYKNDELEYIGHCGTGFNETALKDLYAKFKPLFRSKSPFKKAVKVNAPVQWLNPKLVCQVKFTEFTSEGIMRHPVYLGLRIDKAAKQVEKQIPEKMKTKNDTHKTVAKKTAGAKPAKTEKAKTLPAKSQKSEKKTKAAAGEFQFTNQQKIYWPDDKITKGDLISYYDQVSPLILP
ncbi:MAG: dependent ligase, partial [Bacteroidota bacterium]|nr:dependent ligase [Bacteroidota bacterium]